MKPKEKGAELIMRCVHLDFHTSPDIPGIGEKFDPKSFSKRLSDAGVELVTVFAKCHHGYTYYPTRVAKMHPNLKFDLLGEQLSALRAAGIKAPVYITLGWSKLDADEHPEWHQRDFLTGKVLCEEALPLSDGEPDRPMRDTAWVSLCPLGGYKDHLIAITREICERYDCRDGIFYDICFVGDSCGCDACIRGMKSRGMDPKSHKDAKKYYSDGRVSLMADLTGIVHEYFPGAPVFYNGGADMNRVEYHPYQTHFELEDLPTAWGGYDLMPIRAKFFEKYGKPFLGMTGKFHHAWGEFGGFKNREALRYECADMLSVGASISVGDQLHPSGELDEGTYGIIAHAFDYVRKIERFSENTAAESDLAIWLSHKRDSDIGASKILQTMHLEYDVIESGASLEKYKAIILPDAVSLTGEDKLALASFVLRGGKLIASYESAFSEIGIEKLSPSEYTVDYIRCNTAEVKTPFLAYSSAYRVSTSGEVLAEVFEPYFNRTCRHFSGHKNTPYKTEPASYPALVRCGGALYFAHPVFAAYQKSGSYVLERYIADAILSVYEPSLKIEGLPSAARVRLRREKRGKFLALHILYSPPINRGNVCLLSDFPNLHGVRVSLKTDMKVSSVRLEPSGDGIPFSFSDGELCFELPPFSLHGLVIIE